MICQARNSSPLNIQRTWNEIHILREISRHPNIIRMLSWGVRSAKPYLVLEAVLPTGFDLGRLWGQYELMGNKLPTALSARLFRQLASGLQHLHKQHVLHSDLKVDNVLVTVWYEAKICDFGLAHKVGTYATVRAPYLAPEMCNGDSPMGPKVDSWGLGLILHQLYQHGDHHLLECAPRRYRLVSGKPSTRSAMPTEVSEAMCSLLKEEPSHRLRLDELLKTSWLSRHAQQEPTLEISLQDRKTLLQRSSTAQTSAIEDQHVLKEAPRTRTATFGGEQEEPSPWLAPYRGDSRPLTMAVLIGSQQSHLDGRSLQELGLGRGAPERAATVLLLRLPDGRQLPHPDGGARVCVGAWVLLGVSQVSSLERALFRIEALVRAPTPRPAADPEAACAEGPSPNPSATTTTTSSAPLSLVAAATPRDLSARSTQASADEGWSEAEKGLGLRARRERELGDVMLSFSLHDARSRGASVVKRFGAMFSFDVEFDVFTFPPHMGAEATTDAGSPTDRGAALDLRGAFGINVAGILRQGRADVEWFTGSRCVVRPGDQALVARCPNPDGSTRSTVSKEGLARLMDEERFLEQRRTAPPADGADGVGVPLGPAG